MIIKIIKKYNREEENFEFKLIKKLKKQFNNVNAIMMII